MADAAAIMERLRTWGLDRHGRARCPAHGGGDRNLAVRREGDKVLLTCHSHGCTYAAIVAALGMDPSGRAAVSLPSGGKSKAGEPKCLDREHSAFPYHDADGRVAVTVKRIDYWERGNAKRQKRIRRDPSGAQAPEAGWPLYRLPSLLAHPSAPLLIVEGEKTAEAAQWLFEPAYQATCTIGGAGNAALTDMRPVKGRQCFIWADNDPPGHRHAADLVRLCREHDAAKIAVVPTDDLPPGWDLADA